MCTKFRKDWLERSEVNKENFADMETAWSGKYCFLQVGRLHNLAG
jgi:hypothetical protein